MKRFRIFATAVLFSVCAVMSAQNEEKPEYEYTFNPHLFIQGNVGLQYTLGEVSFFDLTSFNAQLGVGYEFTPSIAARFSVNGWQSRGGMTGDFLLDGKERYWDWKYINPSVDVLVDLTNLIGGFNPERKISAGVLAGIGANFVFSNENAEKVKADLVNNYQTQYNVDICADVMEFIHLPGHEDHTTIDERRSLFWPFRLGAFMDYHINDNWSANLELQANTLSDQYNSKKTWNTDWYFNALIGVKYCFGPTYDKKAKEKMVPVSEAADYAECEPVETVVEKVVEKPVEVLKPTLYEEIYYEINKDQVNRNEKYKVRRIIEFLNENPEAKIQIESYADRATGTPEYNQKISERRAKNVAKMLIDAGIDESRISTAAYGSSKNIYDGADMKLNRVSICTAK